MKLELYYLESCPYCMRVREYIEENGLEGRVIYREVDENPRAEAELEDLTGDTQVPVLVIDGEPVIGSGAIIEWLGENLTEREKTA